MHFEPLIKSDVTGNLYGHAWLAGLINQCWLLQTSQIVDVTKMLPAVTNTFLLYVLIENSLFFVLFR